MSDFKDLTQRLAQEHASVLAELDFAKRELEALRGQIAFTDEHAEPWSPELGVNAWLPVNVQWLFCAGLWLGIVVWLVVSCRIHFAGHKDRNLKLLEKCLPFVLMILFGYPVFFGFVSSSLPAQTWIDFITDILLVLVFKQLKVLIPYLAGGFSGILFLFPVLTALQSNLVAYDYGWYSINVIWTTGASNALTAVAQNNGWISSWSRWVGQSLGWPCLMSGVPLIMMLLGSDFSDAYKLNFVQLLRYASFQFSLYMFIYAGMCRGVEEGLKDEGVDEARQDDSMPFWSFLVFMIGILLQFGNGPLGFPLTLLGSACVLWNTTSPGTEKHLHLQ